MITAINILIQEHHVIISMLTCLERLIEQAELTKKLDEEYANHMITFFREFADACHHGKEEDVLFLFSDEKTGGTGPVVILKEEHAEGRIYVKGLIHNVSQAAAGNQEAIALFGQNGRDMIDMLRRHIKREDEVVFPMIEELSNSGDAQRLWQDFVSVEKDAGGDRHRRFISLTRLCCTHFNVPFLETKIPDLFQSFA